MKNAIVMLMIFAIVSVAHADSYIDGTEAYKSGDYQKAYSLFNDGAQKGNADSQWMLAVMYYEGKGVPQDYQETFKWCHLAAEQGNVKAQSLLGVLYANGLGVQQDDQEAFKWMLLAAGNGDVGSQSSLGLMYVQGRGVEKSYENAYAWWLIAAGNGDAEAQDNLERARNRFTLDQIGSGQKIADEISAGINNK